MVMRGSAGLEDSWEHWIEAETYKSPKVGMKFTRTVKFTAFSDRFFKRQRIIGERS